MYGQHHPLSYETGQGEKYVLNLTLRQAFWLGLGLWSSYQLGKVLPLLPVPQGLWPLKYIHFLLPLALCWGLGEFRKDGLPLYLCLMHRIAFSLRPRKLTWRRRSED